MAARRWTRRCCIGRCVTSRSPRPRGCGTGPGRSQPHCAGWIRHRFPLPPGGGELDITTRTRNAIQRSLRCLGERGFALLSQRWRTLQHITASPSKIGIIARAALVLTHFEHGYIT